MGCTRQLSQEGHRHPDILDPSLSRACTEGSRRGTTVARPADAMWGAVISPLLLSLSMEVRTVRAEPWPRLVWDSTRRWQDGAVGQRHVRIEMLDVAAQGPQVPPPLNNANAVPPSLTRHPDAVIVTTTSSHLSWRNSPSAFGRQLPLHAEALR